MNNCGSTYRWWQSGLSIGLLGCALLAGCAPFPAEEGKQRGGKHGDRSDPLAFPGDDVIVTETDIGLRDYAAAPSDTVAAQPRSRTAAAKGGGPGYDVQFHATLNIQEAKQIQRQTDTLTTMPVRVVFEEPYYKVMAGPYPTFEDAQEFLKLITRVGYSTAWIVARKDKSGE